MSKREVSILITAKNAVAKGLASAGAMIGKFSSSIWKGSKYLAAGFLAAAAAVVGFGAKALQAYATQEAATRSLQSALRSYGDEVTKNTANVQRFASAIQDETGYGDEAAISLAARLRMLGVLPKNLEAATKATIGLASAGMGEEQAIKAVANAQNGNFQALMRYLPALRTATSEAEKAAVVNDFVTKGYQQQKDALQTVSGRWSAFKGRVGDAMEEVGRMIDKTGIVQSILESASAAAIRFGNAVKGFVDSERFAQLKSDIEGVVKALASGGEMRGQAISAMMDVIVSGFMVAAEGAAGVLMKAAPVIGRLIGDFAAAALNKLKPVAFKGTEFEQARKDLGMPEDSISVFNLDRYDNIQAIRAKARENRLKKETAGLDVKEIENTEGLSASKIKLAQAIARLQAVAAKANEPTLADEIQDFFSGEEIIPQIEQLGAAVANTADEISDTEIDIKTDAINEKLNDAEKRLESMRDLAAKTVDEILNEEAQREGALKRAEKNTRKAAEIEMRMGKGVKISKGQQAWLDAFNAIKGANIGLPQAQNDVQALKDQLKQMEKTNELLESINDNLVMEE